MTSDPQPAFDAMHTFVKRHALCGSQMIDLPPLPTGVGYRVIVACRCGDTLEEWITSPDVPRPRLDELSNTGRTRAA